MKVLVVNAGSSSMKFTLFAMENEQVLAKGVFERLGTDRPVAEPIERVSTVREIIPASSYKHEISPAQPGGPAQQEPHQAESQSSTEPPARPRSPANTT